MAGTLIELNLRLCPQFGNRDLAVLRGMPLTKLNLSGTQVTELSDLKDLPLVSLQLTATKVKDLSPLKGMKLQHLHLDSTLASDLRPIEGMPLQTLYLANCPNLKDISPLKGMPVQYLSLNECPGLKDLTPLAECKELVGLTIPTQCKGKTIEFLRDLPKLGHLGYSSIPETGSPADEFWKKHGGAAPVKK